MSGHSLGTGRPVMVPRHGAQVVSFACLYRDRGRVALASEGPPGQGLGSPQTHEAPEQYGGAVSTDDSWRRYLEAGAAVGQVKLARAEEIARGLLAPGEDERETAWDELKELTRFSRLMGGQLVDVARAQLTRQLETIGVGSLDQFLERIADLLGPPTGDAPTKSAEWPAKSEPPEPPAPPDPGTEAGALGKIEKAPHHAQGKAPTSKGTDKKNHKGSKGSKSRPEGWDSKAEKKHQKTKGDKKHKKKEKGPASPLRGSEQNRVLTLALPPDSASRL